MSNTNSEPSEIDKKKGETEKAPDWPAFWKEFGIKVLVVTILILTIFLGSVAIFTEKVASLELLPTEIDEFPFNPELQPKLTGIKGPVDININNKYDSIFSFTPIETTSTKIYFDMDKINKSYENEGFINMLNSLKYDPNRVGQLGGFGLYFRDVMCTMIGWNNGVVNGLYGFANKYLPDWLTLVIWPFISTIIYSTTTMINYFACIVSHIINFNDWFASAQDINNEGRVVWAPEGGFGIRRFCEMIAYGFFGFFFVFVFAPILITIYTILSPAFIEATYEKDNKPMPFKQFIKDTVKNNMTPIMAVLSYNLLVTTKNTLGTTYASSVLLAIIIAGLVLHLYSKSGSDSDNSTSTQPVETPISQKNTPTEPVVTPVSQKNIPTQSVVTPVSQKNIQVINPVNNNVKQLTSISQKNTPVINPVNNNVKQITPTVTKTVIPNVTTPTQQVVTSTAGQQGGKKVKN